MIDFFLEYDGEISLRLDGPQRDELKKFLESLATQETYEELDEDFNTMDWFGGNFDDAYSGGIKSGRIQLARELLNKYF